MRQDEDEYGKRNDQDRHKRKVGRAWTVCPADGVDSVGTEGNLSDASGPPNVVISPTSQPHSCQRGPA